MKKILLVLLLFLFMACEKDEDEAMGIDAPILPANLSWGMSMEHTQDVLIRAGYANYTKDIYINYSDNSCFWQIDFDNRSSLSSIVYHYCGDNIQWVRNYWASLTGNGIKYNNGTISWSKVCSEPIETSNTSIRIDDAPKKSLKMREITYTSSLTASYRMK